MSRTIGIAFSKEPRILPAQHGLQPSSASRPRSGAPAKTPRSDRLALLRGRRKDDATFIAIAVVLAGLFVVQLAWVLSMKAAAIH